MSGITERDLFEFRRAQKAAQWMRSPARAKELAAFHRKRAKQDAAYEKRTGESATDAWNYAATGARKGGGGEVQVRSHVRRKPR